MSSQLILASSSPRRKELLSGLGLSYVIDVSDVDESFEPGTSPKDVVMMLAMRKATAVADKHQEGLVIGADTIVVCDDEILGKPLHDEDARSMLTKLQGRQHQVFSGVAIVNAATGESKVEASCTEVVMRALSDEQIHKYVQSGEPRDKAGSYAIQGLGSTIVERIHGDYFTVVGLPLCLLNEMLAEFGLEVI
ncbi:septum formation inhibitor Maf [Paenibacillus albiflavus]|uniref:dTTP/UTP pyrophosphatase n=1 Tax=Paenibacillus albiflavus TaxID=2545760 RepID=A0A4R4E666_9BACL|nr:Maf family protein [Paenibacillus albiflavus]TCZ75166.1 septum formation inhibitor Maf [Paenibacillus albiflavus]